MVSMKVSNAFRLQGRDWRNRRSEKRSQNNVGRISAVDNQNKGFAYGSRIRFFSAMSVRRPTVETTVEATVETTSSLWDAKPSEVLLVESFT